MFTVSGLVLQLDRFAQIRPVGAGYDMGRSKRAREDVNPEFRCDLCVVTNSDAPTDHVASSGILRTLERRNRRHEAFCFTASTRRQSTISVSRPRQTCSGGTRQSGHRGLEQRQTTSRLVSPSGASCCTPLYNPDVVCICWGFLHFLDKRSPRDDQTGKYSSPRRPSLLLRYYHFVQAAAQHVLLGPPRPYKSWELFHIEIQCVETGKGQ